PSCLRGQRAVGLGGLLLVLEEMSALRRMAPVSQSKLRRAHELPRINGRVLINRPPVPNRRTPRGIAKRRSKKAAPVPGRPFILLAGCSRVSLTWNLSIRSYACDVAHNDRATDGSRNFPYSGGPSEGRTEARIGWKLGRPRQTYPK